MASREVSLLWAAACAGASQVPARSALLVKKWRDTDARDAADDIGFWLRDSLGVRVFVAEAAAGAEAEEPVYAPDASFERWTPGVGAAAPDVVVCVGGDGTVLHCSSLFQGAMPPVVAVAFGSLGFMTVHSFKSAARVLRSVFAPPVLAPASALAPAPVSLRMRLVVELFRAGQAPGAAGAVGEPERREVVLNELLIERGPSPYMASLDAFVDGEPLTTVNADGLIIATQTGSTAYALSAGGSILSPATPAITLVPICPHTLSFRPLLFPESATVRLQVPADARAAAWCAFDGRNSTPLRPGDFVVVRTSPFPLPLVCRTTALGDWIRAIKVKLYWNVRERQRPFRQGALPSAHEAAHGHAAAHAAGHAEGHAAGHAAGLAAAAASLGSSEPSAVGATSLPPSGLMPATMPAPSLAHADSDSEGDLYGPAAGSQSAVVPVAAGGASPSRRPRIKYFAGVAEGDESSRPPLPRMPIAQPLLLSLAAGQLRAAGPSPPRVERTSSFPPAENAADALDEELRLSEGAEAADARRFRASAAHQQRPPPAL